MNNPPAFPHVADILQIAGNSAVVKTLTQNGMSLRDYFAAKALQGMLASGNLPKTMPDADIAECSYNLADAMLKAREA